MGYYPCLPRLPVCMISPTSSIPLCRCCMEVRLKRWAWDLIIMSDKSSKPEACNDFSIADTCPVDEIIKLKGHTFSWKRCRLRIRLPLTVGEIRHVARDKQGCGFWNCTSRLERTGITIIMAYHEKGYMDEVGARTVLRLPPYCQENLPVSEKPNHSVPCSD
jgi:hypothetical protein